MSEDPSLCRNFQAPSELPRWKFPGALLVIRGTNTCSDIVSELPASVGSSGPMFPQARVKCSEPRACSDWLSELPTHVGSSGVDPPRGSVSVPTHNYMFWCTIGSSKPGSSNLNSVSLSENVGRSDALSEDPIGSQKIAQQLVFGGWVFIPPHPLHCVLLT